MKTMIIMIGIQASGKSEFCRRMLPEGFDELYFVSITGNRYSVSEWSD